MKIDWPLYEPFLLCVISMQIVAKKRFSLMLGYFSFNEYEIFHLSYKEPNYWYIPQFDCSHYKKLSAKSVYSKMGSILVATTRSNDNQVSTTYFLKEKIDRQKRATECYKWLSPTIEHGFFSSMLVVCVYFLYSTGYASSFCSGNESPTNWSAAPNQNTSMVLCISILVFNNIDNNHWWVDFFPCLCVVPRATQFVVFLYGFAFLIWNILLYDNS